jgi:hypothetical protein
MQCLSTKILPCFNIIPFNFVQNAWFYINEILEGLERDSNNHNDALLSY